MHPNDLVVNYMVIRRNGNVVPFNAEKIRVAIANAFLKDADGVLYHAGHNELSQAEREQVDTVTRQVVETLFRRKSEGGAIHIEDIQDQVELRLMRSGQHEIARNYVLYRMRARKNGPLWKPRVRRPLR
jgi:ribonucleoside-diphosphate reductase alpha chain